MARRIKSNNEQDTGTAVGNANHARAEQLQQIELRRCIVAKLMLRNCTYKQMQAEVKERLNLSSYSEGALANDIKALRKEWQKERLDDTEAYIDLELRRIDEIAGEAWQGWERSKDKPKTIKSRKEGIDAQGTLLAAKRTDEITESSTNGDPRFLAIIANQLQERRKLLGLYKENKPGGDGEFTFAALLMQTGQKRK